MITPERIQELLADNQSAHSDLQMDRFIILANGLTQYGCYKQAVRELHSRFYTLVGYWLDLEELRLDEADAVANAVDPRGKLALAKIRLRIMGLESTAAESRREFLRFLAHADYLKSVIGDLTPKRRAEFEREFWVESIKRMGPGPQSQRLLMVMDDESRQEVTMNEMKSLPELSDGSAMIDVDALLRMTVEQRLLPCNLEPN